MILPFVLLVGLFFIIHFHRSSLFFSPFAPFSLPSLRFSPLKRSERRKTKGERLDQDMKWMKRTHDNEVNEACVVLFSSFQLLGYLDSCCAVVCSFCSACFTLHYVPLHSIVNKRKQKDHNTPHSFLLPLSLSLWFNYNGTEWKRELNQRKEEREAKGRKEEWKKNKEKSTHSTHHFITFVFFLWSFSFSLFTTFPSFGLFVLFGFFFLFGLIVRVKEWRTN